MVIDADKNMIDVLNDMSRQSPFPREEKYWNIIFDLQDKGDVSVFIANDNMKNCGFVIFNRKPKYPLFKKMNIPEIQDLFILQDFRGKGLGRALIDNCEKTAIEEGYKEIGIGVGVLPSYGIAQALYVSMGYVPDGQGLTKDRKTIKEHDNIAFNHDLSLMMIKKLH